MQFPSLKKIRVDSFVRNCTDRSLHKNTDDWAAYKITRILKGEEFPYPFYMQCCGKNTQIGNENATVCLQELARQCANRIDFRLPSDQCLLVPVPNSYATPSNLKFKTLEHANMIANVDPLNIAAAPLLLWSTPQQKSHAGGRSRSYQEHMSNLCIHGKTNRKIVLYDDVVTTGSQLIASKLKLEAAGFEVVGMIAVVSILGQDGETHSDVCSWKTEERHYL